jgi:hypothetical protein
VELDLSLDVIPDSERDKESGRTEKEQEER